MIGNIKPQISHPIHLTFNSSTFLVFLGLWVQVSIYMETNGPFAVVAFTDEDSNGEEVVSEIPTNWLIGYDRCYWPNTKNINNLISKSVEPDPEKWKIFSVEVKCFCGNYNKKLAYNCQTK